MNDNQDNIVKFPGGTFGPIPVDTVLEGAKGKGYEECIVVGMDKDGQCHVYTSTGYNPDILWMIEMARTQVVDA